MWPFSKRSQPIEKRSAMSGFTAELISAREAYITGRSGFGELTATAQSCISLWENGMTLADVEGTDLLESDVLAMIGRSLAVRGESVWLIGADRLIPCSDWDLRTKFADPVAYRISIPEAGGGTTQTVLAAEVLHFKIGCDAAAPWFGVSPLRRSRLTAQMLHSVETALAEVFEWAPLGSQVVPMPETPDTDNNNLAGSFRGQRGRVLLRESVTVSAAGGPVPQTDWKPASLTPDLQRAMTRETLDASRDGILAAFGVLPGLFNPASHGPMVRECQRHLAQWTLQPIAELIADEATDKLGVEVSIDTQRPLHAFDANGRARAMLTIAQALAMAKSGDVAPADISKALELVDWGD